MVFNTLKKTRNLAAEASGDSHAHSNLTTLNNLTQDVIDNEHAHSNLTTLNNLTQNVIDNEHVHSNLTILNATTAAYTTTAATKLSGIATNANNYIHPAEHPIGMITDLPAALDKAYGSFYLSGAGVTGLGATVTTLTINSTGVNSGSMTLATDEVTVAKTGTFSIDFHVYLNNSSTARVEFSMWLEKDTVEVPGTRFASYQRGYDSGMTSGTSLIMSITSGEVFRLRVQLTDGTTTSGYQDVDGTRLNIKEL